MEREQCSGIGKKNVGVGETARVSRSSKVQKLFTQEGNGQGMVKQNSFSQSEGRLEMTSAFTHH